MKKHLDDTSSDYQELISALKGLALDLRWSWNHAAHLLWKTLDQELWRRTRNPVLLLQTISREQLMRVAQKREFKQSLRDVLLQSQTDVKADHRSRATGPIAYFSMEYLLTETLPIYSGGLGNVAGDQLKAASDLNVPVIGIGLLFQQGYFRQEINSSGEQKAYFPFNNPSELPITPLRTEDGEWVRVKLTRPNYTLWLRVWQATVGSARLYLLDTNDPTNDPVVRLIGSELYGEGPQLRLRQEIILGIGGWRLLHELAINPSVCHMNEGHAAFAVLERARCFMEDNATDFQTALAATRAGNVFTTHTPVAAAFDCFSPQLMESHLKYYAEEGLHIPFRELLALGRLNPENNDEPFNMAYLAFRGSGAVNGVSQLHREVSRRIFQNLFPRWPEYEVPIGYVTNGVHAPTWASAEASSLWNASLARRQKNITPRSISGPIQADALAGISDRQLWEFRSTQRQKLITYTRERLAEKQAAAAITESAPKGQDSMLDPEALTMAFARRFAEYKRPTLLLHDPERLARILTDSERPAQLIIAGKAHPADHDGQSMIKQWNDFIQRYQLHDRVVFLADYDMHLTQKLVQGADLWINTPRRPWEACGTSGMKVLVNGGLNLSELDGWWAEAYTSEVGWAVGSTAMFQAQDARDADRLYTILEEEVKPAFYDKDVHGIPQAWIAKMRASMSQLTSMFSAHRALNEYIENYYRPAALAYSRRVANKARVASEIIIWHRRIEQAWPGVRILSRHTTRQEVANRPAFYEIVVEACLGDLAPSDVSVEVFANEFGETVFRRPLELVAIAKETEVKDPKPEGTHLFVGQISADRPDSYYTVRVIPHHPEVRVPLEMNYIVWEK